MTDWTRRAATGVALGLLLGGGRASAQQVVSIESPRLQRGGLTLPVRIDGRGPFVFVVDSAANASMIAADLAAQLALPPDGEVAMHTLIGRELVGAVRAGSIETGALHATQARLALASRIGLEGADGLIGTDLLAGLRLDLRFRGAARARVARSRQTGAGFFDPRLPRARLVRTADRRFGPFLTVEGRAGGVRVAILLDTGAQISVGNRALVAAAGAAPATLREGSNRGRVQSPTGRSAGADMMSLPNLHFGGASVESLPLLIGDFHIFEVWGLASRPALLMGVDVLRLFERVAIDLGRGEVVFEL